MFGHIGIDATSEACKYLGYDIQKGTIKPCVSCNESKAKKKPIPSISKREPSTIPNQLVFLDISTVKQPANVTTLKGLTKPNWRLIVDDYSELANGAFFEQKDGMVEPTCELFHL